MCSHTLSALVDYICLPFSSILLPFRVSFTRSLTHSLTPLFLPFPFSPFICFLLLMQCSVVFAWSGSSRRGDTACPPIRRAGVLAEQCHLQSHALLFRSQPYTEAEQARCHFGKWRSLFVSVFKLFALIILFTVSVKEHHLLFSELITLLGN